MSGELSEFVVSISTSITRRADRYVEMVEERRSLGTLPETEPELLDRFERYAADVLDRYVPPGPRTRESLVFAHLYSAAISAAPEAAERTAIAALLAAEAESRGPLRLTPAQTTRLALILERLGRRLLDARLPLHAALALTRASALYLQVENQRARDRCELLGLRARHGARDRGWLKALEKVSDLVCGYGYEPYRLLGWVLVQLAAFSAVIIVGYRTSVGEGLYICLVNYLNPLGLGDSRELRSGAWLLVAESYAGLVSMSVFFALVVRRWFRL
jgi:hypothetical protein